MYEKLRLEVEKLIGQEVIRPTGSLSGHNAGLPFETLVYERFSRLLPNQCFRHFEVLNSVLLNHRNVIDPYERSLLFGPPSIQSLVCRGRSAMKDWKVSDPFHEKQDDTAEIIILDNRTIDFINSDIVLIDVKTKNLSIASRPPNIISAKKLVNALADSIKEGKVKFDIYYVGIGWKERSGKLVCEKAEIKSLFKIDSPMYINWAAATQIQFNPLVADQSFTGNKIEWAKKFVNSFCKQLERRINKDKIELKKFMDLINS